MMVGLDTSVVLRLLIGEPANQAKAAVEFLNQLFESGDQAAVSDMVISETYFALQYHYKVPKAEALEALRKLFESREIRCHGNAADILQNTPSLARAKPGFVDRLIHAEYRNEIDGMATFEKKAGKLESTQALKALK